MIQEKEFWELDSQVYRDTEFYDEEDELDVKNDDYGDWE